MVKMVKTVTKKVKRKPSAYNLHMKSWMLKLKRGGGRVASKAHFKAGAAAWKKVKASKTSGT